MELRSRCEWIASTADRGPSGRSIYTRRWSDSSEEKAKRSPGSDRGWELGVSRPERDFFPDLLSWPVFEHGNNVASGPADTIDWAVLRREGSAIRMPDGDASFHAFLRDEVSHKTIHCLPPQEKARSLHAPRFQFSVSPAGRPVPSHPCASLRLPCGREPVPRRWRRGAEPLPS